MFTDVMKKDLEKAILEYDFPTAYFEFKTQERIDHSNMCPVEEFIYLQLISDDLDTLKGNPPEN